MALVIPETTVAAAALVVSAIVTTIVLVRRWHRLDGWQRLSVAVLGVYTPVVLGVTLGGIPIELAGEAPEGWTYVSLVPFATISDLLSLIADSPFQAYMRQLYGNLILLAPLGFLLPVLHPRFRRLRDTTVAVLAASLAIELSQLAISLAIRFPYRAFDVDDLILNTIGGVLGWAVWRITLGLLAKRLAKAHA
ncbi:MAG: VanZ family protein [Actinomycetota bacterium]